MRPSLHTKSGRDWTSPEKAAYLANCGQGVGATWTETAPEQGMSDEEWRTAARRRDAASKLKNPRCGMLKDEKGDHTLACQTVDQERVASQWSKTIQRSERHGKNKSCENRCCCHDSRLERAAIVGRHDQEAQQLVSKRRNTGTRMRSVRKQSSRSASNWAGEWVLIQSMCFKTWRRNWLKLVVWRAQRGDGSQKDETRGRTDTDTG